MANDPVAIEKARELEANATALQVGSPTIFELYVGVALSKKAEREKAKITSVINSLTHIPLDHDSAKAAGIIYGEKVRSGSTIDPEDAMLAGIALAHEQPIITRNAKHFSNIEGVRVETY